MDAVGSVIDEVTRAGGDIVRIDGIRFAIDRPEQYARELRATAAKDALNRATQIASAMNETLGRLASATEGGRSAPSMMMMEARSVTPISAGDMELRAEVDAVFMIQSL
jgi:uncharacterized protein YggE